MKKDFMPKTPQRFYEQRECKCMITMPKILLSLSKSAYIWMYQSRSPSPSLCTHNSAYYSTDRVLFYLVNTNINRIAIWLIYYLDVIQFLNLTNIKVKSNRRLAPPVPCLYPCGNHTLQREEAPLWYPTTHSLSW
jgi:hypothetical protein